AAPATARATGTSPARPGIEATAVKAKITNSGPGGCQSCTSDSQAPTPAITPAIGTASQVRWSLIDTQAPRPTAPVSNTASSACSSSLGRAIRLRPYSEVNAPNAA